MNTSRLCIALCLMSLLLVCSPINANACSCAMSGHSPFLTKEKLPVNAKGVLYFNPFIGGMTDRSRNTYIVRTLPDAPTAMSFTARDDTEKTTLEVRVKQIDTGYLTPSTKNHRYFRFKKKETEKCFWEDSQTKQCRELSQFRYKNDSWIIALHQRGELIDVTKEVKQRIGLFRIEPVNGFTANHIYSFEAKATTKKDPSNPYSPRLPNGTLRVTIDSTHLTMPLREKARIRFNDERKLSLISIPSGGACSSNVLADVQTFSYDFPKDLIPYSKSVLFFTAIDDLSESTDSSRTQRLWNYRSSACSSVQWGKTEKGFGQDLLYSPCNQNQYLHRGIQNGTVYSIKGYYGLLEVQDRSEETNVEKITFPKRSPSECSTSKLLSSTLESNDIEKIKKQICQFSGAFGGQFKEDPIALLTSVMNLSTHQSIQIRRCAVRSLSYLGHQLQQVKNTEVFSKVGSEILPLLVTLAQTDQDPTVRKSASKALESLARVGQRQSIVIKESLETLVIPITELLFDDEKDVRIAAASVLSSLGNDARQAVPKILEALKNSKKPTYSLPTALVNIDPTNEQTIPALLDTLTNSDSLVKGAAARGLGKVGVFDDRVVPALMKLAKKDSQDAIRALGELGSQSTPAAPLLLNIASKSKWAYLRKEALTALSKIGTSEKKVIAAIFMNLKNPIDTYIRQHMIETLGTFGSKAQETIPELLEVLDDNLTSHEISTLIKTLDMIGAQPQQTKPFLRKMLDHEKDWLRERIAEYLLKLDPLDGSMLTHILRDTRSNVIQKACRVINEENASHISHKQEVAEALGEIIADETRYQDTMSCALRAATVLAINNPTLCESVKLRKSKLTSTYEIERYLQMEESFCE